MRSLNTRKNISELYFHVASLNRRFPVLYRQDDCFQKNRMSLFFYKASCTGAPHALQWRTNQLNVAKFNAKEQSGYLGTCREQERSNSVT